MNMQRPTINFQGAGIGRSQKSHPRLSSAATAAIFPALLGESSSPRGFVHQMCPSTKRTHRFLGGKQQLSNCDTMGYAGKICQETVGSFWKTNPPGGGFEGVEQGNWVVLGNLCASQKRRYNRLERRPRLSSAATEEGSRTGEIGCIGSAQALSCALRASIRRDAFSVLPPHLETAKRTHL